MNKPELPLSAELLPCPFCGWTPGEGNFSKVSAGVWLVHSCDLSGRSGFVIKTLAHTKGEAIAAWNRRATKAAALPEDLAALTPTEAHLLRRAEAAEASRDEALQSADMWMREAVSLRAARGEILEVLGECADELEVLVEDRYALTRDWPSEARRYERDIAMVRRARALLSAKRGKQI